MENYIILGVLLLLVGSACFYIYKKKKQGAKCIGCPNASSCPKCNNKNSCE